MFSATACLPQDSVAEHHSVHVHNLPKLLKCLHDPQCKDDDIKLKQKCEKIFDKGIKVTSDEAAYLEESTRQQAESLV